MGLLTQDELKQVYNLIIKPRLFNHAKESGNKTCIFLGGQPGAGKSYLTDISIDSLDNRSAVVIDSDLLRNYHPKNTPLFPEKDIYSLDEDCYAWGSMLIDDCMKENKNVVFDGTFGGNVKPQIELMRRFKENGYSTKLNLLSANEVVSKLGVCWRYGHQKKNLGRGRPVDMEYHDMIYQRIPQNLETVFSQKGLIDEFSIYGRNHVSSRLHCTNTFNAEMLQQQPGSALEAYMQERCRPFTPDEIKMLNGWFNQTRRLTGESNGDVLHLSSVLENSNNSYPGSLRKQINEICKPIIKGYLGHDTQLRQHNGKPVAVFAVAESFGRSNTVWTTCQAWDPAINTTVVKDLKKGDLIELSGRYGKPYTDSRNQTRRDVVVEQCAVLKLVEKRQEKRARRMNT